MITQPALFISHGAPTFAGRMALRLDVRSNAESRKWLLTLGLAPHLTLADVPLLSLHGTVGATWE